MGSDNKRTYIKKPDICTLVYMSVWIVTEVLLLLKCRIGYVGYDESLYLTIPYRFVLGDAMIVDEWNLSQLFSFTVMPYVWSYLKITGGTAGIFLAYRYFSVIIWGIAAAFFYIRLRKYTHTGAAAASFLFMIYAPYGVPALSYNTLGILAIAGASTILLPINDKIRIEQYYIAGLLFAGSVLCCPQVMLLWVAGFIYAMIKRNIKGFLVFTAGSATLAVALMVFILGRAHISDVLKVIPVILDDPYHQQVSIFGYIKEYILQLVFGIKHGVIIYGCLTVFAILIRLDKKRTERKIAYFICACLLTIVVLAEFLMFNRYINFFVYPVCILAFICRMLSDDANIGRLFIHYWIPGIIYSFCINMASNQYLKAITAAGCVAMIGSVVITSVFVREILNAAGSGNDVGRGPAARAVPVVLSLAVALLTLLPLAYLRYRFVFWDKEVWSSSEEITTGPMKGIMASSGKAEHYTELYEDAEGITGYGEKTVFFMRDNWPYLLEGVSCSAYSPWLQNEIDDYAVSRLIRYYELDESRRPDVIFIDTEYEVYADKLCGELGYKAVKATSGGYRIAVPDDIP